LLVLGTRNAGKTTFIRSVTGKDRTRTWTQVAIKEKHYRIQLVELLLEDVDFSSERRIEWPPYVNGVPLPEVDGVFCLYDVADKESVADVPAALSKSHHLKYLTCSFLPQGLCPFRPQSS
jgi:GTPase SAR1 family protein